MSVGDWLAKTWLSWSAAAVLVLAPAATLSAQGQSPERRLTLVQRSYWLSDGFDPAAVSPAETTLVAADSAAAGDSLTTGRYGSLPLTLTSWLSLARRAHPGAWRETREYRYAVAGDTLVLHWTREPRVLGSSPSGHEGRLRLSSTTRLTIEAWSTVEQDIDPPGVRVRTRLSGSVEEQLLYDSLTRQVDSVHARGTLTGRLTFEHPNGLTVTVKGRWVVAQDACWVGPPDSAAAIWVFGDPYVDAPCPAPGQVRRDFWPLAVRAAQADTLALDSLFALRRREPDPLRRAPASMLDRFESDPGLFLRRAIVAYRPGDADLLSRLVWRSRYFQGGGYHDPRLAAILAREFRDVRHERAAGIDREAIVTEMRYAFTGGLVSEAVGPIYAAAARTTNDPVARDLFLLAAYRSAPQRYGPLLDRLAAPGGWVRRSAAGASSPWDTTAFPGIAAPWRAHTRYLDGPFLGERILALRAWFGARRLDPAMEFRERFFSEPDTAGRFVWAQYLLALGDTAPAAWLVNLTEVGRLEPTFGTLLRLEQDKVARAAYVRRDSLGKSAFGLLWRYRSLVTQAVRDSAVLTGVVVRVLGCDEPPDSAVQARLLLNFGVTPEAKARCGWRFHTVWSDSVVRLADRVGEVNLTVISPVLRIGNRYVIDVGEHCLTRGYQPCPLKPRPGKRYLLEYRDGRWFAVLIAGWEG